MDKDVSAIFAFNDMCAYGVYNRLKRLASRFGGGYHPWYDYDNIFSEILDVPRSLWWSLLFMRWRG
ncbi:MAG: hypothetical protein ACLTBV_16500 [Enterocloster bolteae]